MIPLCLLRVSVPSLFRTNMPIGGRHSRFSSVVLHAVLLSSYSLAQHVTVPSTCSGRFEAGTDEVVFTTPYTYTQVLSIIGSYKNLTWSGNPDDTVSLNGTDNTVGTARTYDTAGAHVIETILEYSKPAAPGPYVEVHNTALLTVPAADNLTFYIPFDGTVVKSVCDGKASQFNFTANFCASNATAAAGVLHMLHLNDAITVGRFLGGMNFTSCAALGAGNASGTGGVTMPTPSLMPYNPNSGAIAGVESGLITGLVGAVALFLALM